MEKQIAEDSLIELLKNKKTKKEGVTALINKHHQQLYWHIRKLVVNHDDAKDVLQEVFLRVWRNIDKFKGDSKLFTWLYRIANNEAIRFLEKKQRLSVNKLSVQEMLTKELETASYISGEEIQMKLQKAIVGLPEKQRIVFNMRYFEELEYADIAEVIESTANSVKVLYHYAKNSIEEQLKNEI
jgi:RNA polymerase sigma factor (sigma-70 family)